MTRPTPTSQLALAAIAAARPASEAEAVEAARAENRRQALTPAGVYVDAGVLEQRTRAAYRGRVVGVCPANAGTRPVAGREVA